MEHKEKVAKRNEPKAGEAHPVQADGDNHDAVSHKEHGAELA